MFDLVIRNGTLVTEDEVLVADLGVQDGGIAAWGSDLGPARREIDATAKYVLPGGIDSHVHLAQPSGDGIVMADDFESGTLSALFGGNTTVMPFCLQERERPLRATLSEYHEKAEGKCYTDVSFHLIVCDPSPSVLGQELPALISGGYTSFKVFMTYEGLRLNDAQILATMDLARRTGALVMVHCENEDAIRYLIGRQEDIGNVAPKAHATARPIVVEREATHRALSLAEVVDVPVVIVHVSNGPAIQEIRAARARGQKVIGETCPQYLVLTADDLDGMDWEGAKFVCSPPPRDVESQAFCWNGIETGLFDLFSSDHCPFRFDDARGKLNPRGRQSFRYIPNGIPGIETRLPILFSEGVVKGRIDLKQFVALTASNHARIYGLETKGRIAVGADADLAIWDPEIVRTIAHDELHDAADYSPYEGMTVQGWPTTVILGGKIMIENGTLVGEKGSGKYRPRALSPLGSRAEPSSASKASL
ncbi:MULTISPECIES: dihydropyrimidinase [Mesorhizobium]|uniref:Dihydropyrimidinase n=1 Tax=Mesorhizobium qingshengii TaxID=1165689 RepID=A0A1G5ZWW0_9HYPH|nr:MULTISPECIES: dihydropyrimidinase [Mesorhizobium]AID34972.1 dihydropyrimidinase [Mesorhizobium huakuii 7653R]MCH4560635.1 dihydropyrimidinase [Mesorhizobium jarvisii]SDA99107.1 dihydropyrimidinase [Mesorhizobium qingshengii]